MKNCLIVGGTSGLGLEMAKILRDEGHRVIVVGRHNPGVNGLEWRYLDLDVADLHVQIEKLAQNLPRIQVFVYGAGFFQKGLLTDLSIADIEKMMRVGMYGPMYFVRQLLLNQGSLDRFALLSSTSQWTPRREEPVYCAAKAGSAHFARSIALSGDVHTTLLVGLSGMRTPFWEGTDKDTTGMFDPKQVAGEVLEHLLQNAPYQFREMHVLRKGEQGPDRVEVILTTYASSEQ